MGRKKRDPPTSAGSSTAKPRCGLCGKSKKMTKTDCCGNWICDDEGNYVLFSYARNSCHRNHRRYTLCGYHHTEDHPGCWQDCKKCLGAFEAEMVAHYGTNQYNFEKLANPPGYAPTKCARCDAAIVMADGGHSHGAEGYLCPKCTAKEFRGFL